MGVRIVGAEMFVPGLYLLPRKDRAICELSHPAIRKAVATMKARPSNAVAGCAIVGVRPRTRPLRRPWRARRRRAQHVRRLQTGCWVGRTCLFPGLPKDIGTMCV